VFLVLLQKDPKETRNLTVHLAALVVFPMLCCASASDAGGVSFVVLKKFNEQQEERHQHHQLMRTGTL